MQEKSKNGNIRQMSSLPTHMLRNGRVLCRIRFRIEWDSRIRKEIKLDSDVSIEFGSDDEYGIC